METQKEHNSALERFTLQITEWMGTPYSIIAHTFFFIGIFALTFVGMGIDKIMLILTTVVSLEAIYLSLFIQMTVNRSATNIQNVGEDVEELSEDVDTISENVDELSEDVEGISEDVEEISENINEDDAQDLSHTQYLKETHRTIKDIEIQLQVLTEGLLHLKKDVALLHQQKPKTTKSPA